MKFTFFISLLVCITLFASCNDDEEYYNQVNSTYQGNYSGSFIGDSEGNISFVVKKEAGFNGDLKVVGAQSENFLGYVATNGKFDINTRAGYFFSGYLNKTTVIKGSWYNSDGRKGTYEIKFK